MWGVLSSRTLAIGAATIVFVASSILPLVFMIGESRAFTSLLLDARQWTLLSNTTQLGMSTAVLATLLGVPLGVALARIPLPCKGAVRVLLAAPLLLPPSIAAMAWISLGGGAGLIAQWLGRDPLSAWTYSMSGAVLVLSLVLYPVSMLATEVAVRRIEPQLEEAALIVTTPTDVLWRITLRLAAPGIVAAALVIFVLAISEFSVPGLLRVRVFTTEVFTAFAALYDFNRATAMAVPLLLLAAMVAATAVTVVGERLVTTRRGGGGESTLLHRWTSVGIAGATIMVTIGLVLPLVLLWREASGVRSWTAVVKGSGTAIRNSLVLATAGATLTTAVGLILGYWRASTSQRVGFVADLGFVVLFSVPSTIVGVSLIALWNRSGVLGAVYGTSAMLLAASLARFLPLAALGMAAAFQHVPRSHEEAAATAGAGWARTMTHIVVPQVATAFMAIWVVVFVLAFGELGASILVSPPGESTLPIRIYTLIANAPPAEVAALALLQAGVILAPLVLLAYGIAKKETR